MSKYYPANAKDDYLYYVEGNHHPTTAPVRKNIRWERSMYGNPKYPTSANYVRRPCSSTFNQVLYSNPRFTANSSQATIPFDSETEDRRLKNYTMQYKSIHSPVRTSNWTADMHHHVMNPSRVPSRHIHANNPTPILKKPHLEDYSTLPNKYHNYPYSRSTNECYPNSKKVENHLYSETEETESETATEDEYTESEDSSVYSKYKLQAEMKSRENEKVISSSKDRGDKNTRSAINVDKMMKSINVYNRCQPGKKMQVCDLETLVNRFKKEPVKDKRYIYKNSRCLESSYVKAAEVLKTAKSNAEAVQRLKIKQNKYDPYEQYRRKQYSQLLRADSGMQFKNREVALGRDTSGNVYLGSQNHVKQISSQYSVLKPKTPKESDTGCLKCAPIPEEQQSDVLDIKTIKKTTDIEQPVKLLKEINEPLQFTSNASFPTQPKKMPFASKDRLSIYHKSRRLPHRKRNFMGIYSCAKALKKFTEYSQISIQKQPGVSLTTAKVDLPKLNLTLNTSSEKVINKNPLISDVQSTNRSINEDLNKITDDVTSEFHKNHVTMNVNNMISKLNEIENLINSKKSSLTSKRESSTSHSSFNIGAVTSTSIHNSGTELVSNNSRKSKKKSRNCRHCKISIPENSEIDTNDIIKTIESLTDAKESNKQVSFTSTKSAIASLVSAISTKLLSSNKYDSTDTEAFKSIFQLNELDPSTSRSRSTRRSNDSTYKLKTKKCKSSSDTSNSNTNLSRSFKQSAKHLNKNSSVVTVFSASKRNLELTAESATTNPVSEIINKRYINTKKTSKIPKPKRHTTTEESSTNNTECIVRPKYRRKKHTATIERVSEENQVGRLPLLNSLRSAFCIIVNFFFRYFRNLFIF